MRSFNVTGVCIPEKHYMVDVSARVQNIKATLVSPGQYFTINRARQYGKTTTLYMLEKALQSEYAVISLSFEAADDLFQSRYHFAIGFIKKVSKRLKVLGVESNIVQEWEKSISKEMPFEDLNDRITALCQSCSKKIVLMLDEVDKSSDNQIFLSFLGLLRTKYLELQKGEDDTFFSVILAGVYDIKNLKLKYRTGEEEKYNSPWNVAADFDVDMSFSANDIATMLEVYEQDHHTGMVISAIANELYAYTSGYPYLVSRLCQLIDENMQDGISWNHQGILAAVRLLLKDKNTLFDDIQKKLTDFPQLRDMLYAMLFQGITYPYHAYSNIISVGESVGFIKERNNQVVVANRIYEMWIYNLFIAEDSLHDKTIVEVVV
ncbi:MAG: AAA-like domain-containing protein [Eubacterium sp.]|nr:AAA-like domain-containing protein [Eubacterium sp.]